MKKLLLILVGLLFSVVLLQAQSTEMYIMKSGNVIDYYYISNVDSVIFYNPAAGSFTDSRDNNVYQTIAIGTQVWMAENLKYLPEAGSEGLVGSATSSDGYPYYYVYGYNGTDITEAKATENYDTYGVLYNWSAAMKGEASSDANPSGVQGICPTGWHLPSSSEWTQMESYLIANGYNYDGSITDNKIAISLAETTNWSSSTVAGATGNPIYAEFINKSGFTALPGGRCVPPGGFGTLGSGGSWWSSKAETSPSTFAQYRGLDYDEYELFHYAGGKENGLSIRCLKD
ncbi:MAG: FISUMP domain-containing protein [Bacteroidales bacterium]|nr:FISUMP domain-containing protein [Bacteroidales bacterium]